MLEEKIKHGCRTLEENKIEKVLYWAWREAKTTHMCSNRLWAGSASFLCSGRD